MEKVGESHAYVQFLKIGRKIWALLVPIFF